MIQSIVCDGVSIDFKHIKFSDGSSNLKLLVEPSFVINNYYSITIDPSTPGDAVLWEIMLAKDALNCFRKLFSKRYLHMSYLPHARADRRFEIGNSFPLNLFLDAITHMNFNEIFLTDPHSDYFTYGMSANNIEVTETKQWECFLHSNVSVSSGDVLVAPDKGARGKIVELQQHLDNKMICTFVVEASKKRDKETGRIIDTTLSDNCDVKGKRCIIVDDLLDAGGTFIPLAEKLKEAGASQVDLYVTHGIFAKGLDIFSGLIDNIYCYQIVGNYITQKDLINFNKGN